MSRRTRSWLPLALLALLAYASVPAFVGGGVSSRPSFERSKASTARPATKDLQQVLSKIKDTISEGEFGKRGEEYVAAQVFLILCVLVGTVPLLGGSLYFLAGPLCMAAGGAIVAAALYEIGDGLSPWVTPSAESELKTGGVFEYVRHPIYGGLLLLCFGIAIISNSASRLVLTGVLYLVLDKKADLEEDSLMQTFNDLWQVP